MLKKLSVVAALCAAFGAQAMTVQFEDGLPLTLTTTEINETLTLGLFDSTLGILTGVSLELFSGAEFSFSGTNTAAQAQLANLTSSTSIFWSGPAFLGLLADMNLSASSGNQNYAVGETKNFGPVSDDDGDVYAYGPLAAFQMAGGGALDLSCQSLSGLTVLGGGGNIATTQATEAGCGARIIYTFDERPTVDVPEPGSMALVGLALAGLGLARRRKA